MKSAALLIAFFSLFFAGCRKDDVDYKTPEADVEGTWNYIGYSGGFAGLKFTTVNPNGLYLQIKNSQLITVDESTNLQKCMQYEFQKDSTNYGPAAQFSGTLTSSDTSFLLPMPNMKTFIVNLYSQDTLTLYPKDCDDCFVAYYVLSLKHFSCADNLQ